MMKHKYYLRKEMQNPYSPDLAIFKSSTGDVYIDLFNYGKPYTMTDMEEACKLRDDVYEKCGAKFDIYKDGKKVV